MPNTLFRPLVTIVRARPDQTLVEVSLDDQGRHTAARIEVVDDDILLAAGQATCKAIARMLPPQARLRLSWIEAHPSSEERRGYITASVIVGDISTEEELLGAAFIRTEPQVAAVRAVLDALPRRMGRYMQM
jgi:hypothetical protein